MVTKRSTILIVGIGIVLLVGVVLANFQDIQGAIRNKTSTTKSTSNTSKSSSSSSSATTSTTQSQPAGDPSATFMFYSTYSRTYYVTESCPLTDWTILGQWKVTPQNYNLVLEKLAFQAFKRNAGLVSQFNRPIAENYRVSVSATPDQNQITLVRTETTPVDPVNGMLPFMVEFQNTSATTLTAGTTYYITLEGKNITAWSSNPNLNIESPVAILAYDADSLDDTTLGTFKWGELSVPAQRDVNLTFNSTSETVYLNQNPTEDPTPGC